VAVNGSCCCPDKGWRGIRPHFRLSEREKMEGAEFGRVTC
jgi:hypothetical protein